MKRIQRTIPELAKRCLNPRCNAVMDGKKPHAKTCSAACRKALSRYSPTPKFLPAAKVKQIGARAQKRAKTLKRPPRSR